MGERGNDAGLVELPDGGYFATLTVYHSLHCVRRLHHFMYKDHYYPNITGPDFNRLKAHAGMFIELLAPTLANNNRPLFGYPPPEHPVWSRHDCTGIPLGIEVRARCLYFRSNTADLICRQRIPLGHDDSKHECVNWDKIDDWSKARSFNPMKAGYLSHPTLGMICLTAFHETNVLTCGSRAVIPERCWGSAWDCT